MEIAVGTGSIPPPQENGFNQDFIAFEFDESPPSPLSTSIPAPFADEQPDLYVKGRKRTADEMERDSDYTKKQRTDADSRQTPWADRVDWGSCLNAADMLNEEVKAFVDYMSPTPEEHETRSLIIMWIRDAITREFPEAQVTPFGSFETKLYLPLGDIDLVVTSRHMETQNKAPILYRIAAVLRRANICDNLQVIAKARVPIIKFVTSHGRFAVDISINQTNGLTAGLIVNRFIREFPALRPLVLVVKSFLSQRSMNEVFSGGLGSYSIVCMVTNMLQMHPKIRQAAINPSENLGVLLIDFFETYGRFFQYENVGISLRDGGHFFNKVSRGWRNHQSPGLLCIEDPQDASNDVSKGSHQMFRVRQTLAGAFEVLSASLCLRGSELVARRRGQYVSLTGGAQRTPGQMSLLGSVMGVTQETINHRKQVAKLYSGGVLQRLLRLPMPADNPPLPPFPTLLNPHPSKSDSKNTTPQSKSKSRSKRGKSKRNAKTEDIEDEGDQDQGPTHRTASDERSRGHKHDSERHRRQSNSRSRSPRPNRRHRFSDDDRDHQPFSHASTSSSAPQSRRHPHPYTSVVDDDAWQEADAGSLETLIVHTGSVSPIHGLADNDDEEEEGRYNIRATKAKQSRHSAEDEDFLRVTFIDASDDDSGLDNALSSSSPLRKPPSKANGESSQRSLSTSEKRAFWSAKSGKGVTSRSRSESEEPEAGEISE